MTAPALRVPAAGRVCACGATMVKARSGSLRFRCPSCGAVSDRDPYLDSVQRGAPRLPGLADDQPRRWVLTFSDHPPSANARQTVKARIGSVRKWRTAGYNAAKSAGIPACGRIRLSAVFYRRNLGVADEDNDRSRLKNVVDGVVKAGAVAKDTRAYVEWGECREEHGPRGFALIVEALA